MKRKILAVCIFIVGLGLLMYPIIGNVINVMRQNSVQQEYSEMVEQMDSDTKEQIKNDAEEYNRKLADREIYEPETDEDSAILDSDDSTGYNSTMNVGSDVIAFIKIPKINIELPIFHGTAAVTLEKGIGHLRNTSLPVGGTDSHCVLTGHTGMPSSMLFTDLDKMEEGDMFYIKYLDEIHAYRVDQIKVVSPSDSSDLKIFSGKDYITLLTCYPYGVNSHRLLVRGERVNYDGGIIFGENDTQTETDIETDSSIITETADNAQVSEEIMQTIENDLSSDNPSMISVYGLYVPLWGVIAAAILIIAAAAVLIIVSVKRSRKKKD